MDKIMTMRDEIRQKVSTLKYRDDEVVLTNVFPSMLEEIFEFNKNGIEVVGGRDLDYEGLTNDYYFSGSAYYGTCTVTKRFGTTKPPVDEDDVYTRTSFEHNGRLFENVPPVVKDYDKDEFQRLVESGVLKPFYIYFNRSGSSSLTLFYAKSERDVIMRAFSIWGKYDDIKPAAYVENLREEYNGKYGEEYFNRCYTIRKEFFVLDWH